MLRRCANALRTTLPPSARRIVSQSSWVLWRATSSLRVLPDFLIIGAQRCGSSSLYSYLHMHPAVGGYFRKETYYFDVNYARGEGWYRGHFPLATFRPYVRARFGLDAVVGEATPDYLFHPHAANRIRAFNPDTKLIAILRDPVERALSHYHLERALGLETLPLREALEREGERLEGEWERMVTDSTYWSQPRQHFSYLARGLYCEQLEAWFDIFSREQILILRSEDLFSDPSSVTDRALGFLDLPRLGNTSYSIVNSRDYGAMDPEIRSWLVSYFAQPNENLYGLLGCDFGWQRPDTGPRMGATNS